VDPNPYIALADQMVMVNQGLLYDPLAYINQMANEHDPLKGKKTAFKRGPKSGPKALACGIETGLAFFAAFPGMNRKWLAGHAKASISGITPSRAAKAVFYRGVLDGYYGPTGVSVDAVAIALVEAAGITAATPAPDPGGKRTSAFGAVLEELGLSGIRGGSTTVQEKAHALVSAVPELSLGKATQALKETLARQTPDINVFRTDVQTALIDLYPGDPVAEVIKAVRDPGNFPFKAGSVIEMGGQRVLQMSAGAGGAEQAVDDALKYVGDLAPKVSVDDVQRMGGAFTDSMMEALDVDAITQGGSNLIASMKTDMTEKAGRWSEAMMAASVQTTNGTVNRLVGTALQGVGLPGPLMEAVAGPLSSAAQSACTAGVKSIITSLGPSVLGAMAGPAGLVVGPLVGWGLTRLFGDTPDAPPILADAPVVRYGHGGKKGRKSLIGNASAIADITPLLVLQNLFRANMRWHRAYHPYPAMDFTDFRSTPGPFPSDAVWQRGEQVRSSYYSGINEVPLYGPWTPSGYGSNYRLVLSGRIPFSEAQARFGGNGLRYPPEAGTPFPMTEKGPGGEPIPVYRFIHDAIAEITGGSVGATSLVSRQIRAAFAWGQERPHLTPFTPYLDEIGWAEFICATALIDHWAYSKESPDLLKIMPGNPASHGPGVDPKMTQDFLGPEDISKIGQDPTSSGLAALCFVTQTLRMAVASKASFMGSASDGYGSEYALRLSTDMTAEIQAYTKNYKGRTGKEKTGEAAVNAEIDEKLNQTAVDNEEESKQNKQDQDNAEIKKAGIPVPLVVAGLGVAGYQWWKGRQS